MTERFNNQHQEARTSTKLTSPDLIRLVYHPAPEPLQPFITTLFTLRCDVGDKAQVDATVATVGGLVTGVQRKTTKQGSVWAIVTLEDLDGAVEVMVFPQTYAAAGTLLVDDAILLVRGRIDRPDDDAARLVALVNARHPLASGGGRLPPPALAVRGAEG